MVSSLSPYSTVMDLSATSDLNDLSPGNTILRSQSLHGKQLPSNASGDYANLTLGSLENFDYFTSGYECTSSRFGSLETLHRKKTHDHDPVTSKVNDTPKSPVNVTPPVLKPSSMFYEIEQAMESDSESETDQDGQEPVVEEETDQWQRLKVKVIIPPMEQRFGFSVSGGCDESFPPRVDNVSKGNLTPANLCDLLFT